MDLQRYTLCDDHQLWEFVLANLVLELLKTLVFDIVASPVISRKNDKSTGYDLIDTFLNVPRVRVFARYCHSRNLTTRLIHAIGLEPSFRKVKIIRRGIIFDYLLLSLVLLSVLSVVRRKRVSLGLHRELIVGNCLVVEELIAFAVYVVTVIRIRLIINLYILQHCRATRGLVPAQADLDK